MTLFAPLHGYQVNYDMDLAEDWQLQVDIWQSLFQNVKLKGWMLNDLKHLKLPRQTRNWKLTESHEVCILQPR